MSCCGGPDHRGRPADPRPHRRPAPPQRPGRAPALHPAPGRRGGHGGRRHRARRDVRRHQVPGTGPPVRRSADRPPGRGSERTVPARPTGRRRPRARGARRRRGRAARRAERRQAAAVRRVRLRSGVPGRAREGVRAARARTPRRQGARSRRVQRVPLLPLGPASGRRGRVRRLGGRARSGGDRGAGAAVRGGARLSFVQAQGRCLPARAGDRCRTGAGRGVPRDSPCGSTPTAPGRRGPP